MILNRKSTINTTINNANNTLVAEPSSVSLMVNSVSISRRNVVNRTVTTPFKYAISQYSDKQYRINTSLSKEKCVNNNVYGPIVSGDGYAAPQLNQMQSLMGF